MVMKIENPYFIEHGVLSYILIFLKKSLVVHLILSVTKKLIALHKNLFSFRRVSASCISYILKFL